MPGARHFPGRRAGQVVIAERNAASVGAIEPADDVEHCGLAGAVGSDHARHHTRLRVKADAVCRTDAAECDADIAYNEVASRCRFQEGFHIEAVR